MKKIPYTQGGTMKVVMDRTVNPRSNEESALRAIHRPSQMPKTAPITFAIVNRIRVRGKRSPMMSTT